MNRNLLATILLALIPAAHGAPTDGPAPGKNDDAALFAACPQLARWAATHPHSDRSAAQNDRSRPWQQPRLRKELARRAQADQRARASLQGGRPPAPTQLRQWAAVDADNLKWLKDLVSRQGFATVAQVGASGVADAWLLVQHADRDPAFQQAVLDQLAADPSRSGVSKPETAMLADRVRLAMGQPQRYGTQFVKDPTGQLVPQQPLEDPANVDARRTSMGLMPLGAYRCMLRATYGPPAADMPDASP